MNEPMNVALFIQRVTQVSGKMQAEIAQGGVDINNVMKNLAEHTVVVRRGRNEFDVVALGIEKTTGEMMVVTKRRWTHDFIFAVVMGALAAVGLIGGALALAFDLGVRA